MFTIDYIDILAFAIFGTPVVYTINLLLKELIKGEGK